MPSMFSGPPKKPKPKSRAVLAAEELERRNKLAPRDDKDVTKVARRRATMASAKTGGRGSTLLSDEKLGGG